MSSFLGGRPRSRPKATWPPPPDDYVGEERGEWSQEKPWEEAATLAGRREEGSAEERLPSSYIFASFLKVKLLLLLLLAAKWEEETMRRNSSEGGKEEILSIRCS